MKFYRAKSLFNFHSLIQFSNIPSFQWQIQKYRKTIIWHFETLLNLKLHQARGFPLDKWSGLNESARMFSTVVSLKLTNAHSRHESCQVIRMNKKYFLYGRMLFLFKLGSKNLRRLFTVSTSTNSKTVTIHCCTYIKNEKYFTVTRKIK